MSESKEKEKNEEYLKVKRNLEIFGINGYFNPDSIKLVKNILDNLIKVSKAFKTVKNEKERIEHEFNIQSSLVFPLRDENLKLYEDNSKLLSLLHEIENSKGKDIRQSIIRIEDNQQGIDFENKFEDKNILLKELEYTKRQNEFLLNENDSLSQSLKKREGEFMRVLELHKNETDTMDKLISTIKNENNELRMSNSNLEEEINFMKFTLGENCPDFFKFNKNNNTKTNSNTFNSNDNRFYMTVPQEPNFFNVTNEKKILSKSLGNNYFEDNIDNVQDDNVIKIDDNYMTSNKNEDNNNYIDKNEIKALNEKIEKLQIEKDKLIKSLDLNKQENLLYEKKIKLLEKNE